MNTLTRFRAICLLCGSAAALLGTLIALAQSAKAGHGQMLWPCPA